MSIQTIYTRLVQAGMSPESACGMMGNFQAESAMRANNVEDRMHRELGMTDEQYTAAVDNGSYANFANDRYGYGLYQLTLPSRKRGYLDFVRNRGTSIADETAQVDYCVLELQRDFPALWSWLKTNKGVAPAAERICREFERPAVNNYKPRNDAANAVYMQLGDMDVASAKPDNSPTGEPGDAIFHTPAVLPSQSPSVTAPSEGEPSYWPPRVLAYGMFGPDVVALQGLMIAHGYPAGISGSFDNATLSQLRSFQSAKALKSDGIAGPLTWSALLRS